MAPISAGHQFRLWKSSLINLRQNTQKVEKVLRELVERAGEAKGYRKRSEAPELVLVLAGNSPVLQTLQL